MNVNQSLLLRFSLACLLALPIASTPAAQAATEPASAAADEGRPKKKDLPKGKWPWFKKYRKGAPAQPPASPSPEVVTSLDPAPVAAPATGPAAAPTTAAAPPPADAAASPSPVDQRRRARATRAPAAAAPASAAPESEGPLLDAAPPVVAVAAPPPVIPRHLRRFERNVRKALDLPETGGAAPVADLTSSKTILRELQPLENRVLAAGDLGPAAAEVHAAYGAALLQHGLEAAAAAECLLAVMEQPDLAGAWNNLATVLRRKVEPDLALQAIDHALEADPGDGIALFNRAMVLDMQGEKLEAETAYVRALEADPSLWLPQQNPLVIGNPDALRALHDLYMKRNAGGGVLVDAGR